MNLGLSQMLNWQDKSQQIEAANFFSAFQQPSYSHISAAHSMGAEKVLLLRS